MTGQRKIGINNTNNVQKRHMEIQYLEFSICRYTGRDVCEVCMHVYKWKYPILQDHAYFRCHRLSNKNHSMSMASLPSSGWSDLPQSFVYCRFWDNVSLALKFMYQLTGYPVSFWVLSVSAETVLRLKVCNRSLNQTLQQKYHTGLGTQHTASNTSQNSNKYPILQSLSLLKSSYMC